MSKFGLYELLTASITRIRVNVHNDSYYFTELCDRDLIELWANYLRTLEIKKIPKPIFINLFKRWIILGGWSRDVIFMIENANEPVYLTFYHDGMICFNKHKCRAVSSSECPLDITCKESVKRHGEFENLRRFRKIRAGTDCRHWKSLFV